MSYLKNTASYGGHSDAYKSNEISTVSQSRLIVMLYDGAIRFLKIASENMTPRKYDLVNNNIIKAQDILTELLMSLNLDEGKDVAKNLMNLYLYMKKRLLEANMAKDAKMILEVIEHLAQLKSAWEEIEKKDTSSKPSINYEYGSGKTKGGLSIQG
jgi:flagellar protein FliS